MSGSSAAIPSLEAHLVVALARAAVADEPGSVMVRLLDQMLDDDRARERRDQRVLVLVERVGLERLGKELLDVLLAHVEHDGLDRADVERLLPHELEVLALLANVHASATTSRSFFSSIHLIATDVSSPPEYASTTLSLAMCFLAFPMLVRCRSVEHAVPDCYPTVPVAAAYSPMNV